jgi:hypothetical protein
LRQRIRSILELLDQRRLACAVRTQQPHAIAGHQLQTRVAEHLRFHPALRLARFGPVGLEAIDVAADVRDLALLLERRIVAGVQSQRLVLDVHGGLHHAIDAKRLDCG